MRVLGLISLLTVCWLGLAILAMLPGTIQTAAIPATKASILDKLSQDISVIGARSGFLILQSDDPRYVRELYAAGAGIVLPARQKTCLSFQSL